MNKENAQALANQIAATFKDVTIKRVPKVGGGWSFPAGSDTHGGEILYVSPDLSWFFCDGIGGFAKLETRKNAFHHGRYVHAYLKFTGEPLDQADYNFRQDPNRFINWLKEQPFNTVYKMLKPEPTSHCLRCEFHNVRQVHEAPVETYYDPSF